MELSILATKANQSYVELMLYPSVSGAQHLYLRGFTSEVDVLFGQGTNEGGKQEVSLKYSV